MYNYGVWDVKRSCANTCMAFSSRESQSAPMLATVMPRFLHSENKYSHRFNTRSAMNLLFVPIQAKQKAGTPLQKGCAMYTNVYLATSATRKFSSIDSKETAIKASLRGSSFSFHGNTNPTSMSVSLSYSTQEMTHVASSL